MGEDAQTDATRKRWFWNIIADGLKTHPKRKFWVLIVAMFVGGGLLIWVCLPEEGVKETALKALGDRIGDALIIAAILGGIVERALDNITQPERSSELERDIAFAILGKHLPKELTERIRSYFEQTVARPKVNITFTISTCKDDVRWFKVISAIDYEVQNYYDQNRDYTFEYWQEDSPGSGHPSIIAKAQAGDTFDGHLNAHIKPEPGYLHFRAPKSYELMARGTGGSSQHFYIEAEQHSEQFGMIPYWATDPILVTELKVIFPENEFSIRCDLSHGTTPDPEPTAGGLHWTFQQPILPGQGFVVMCRMKNAQASSHGTTKVPPAALPPVTS
jgi:hypothetical protein